MALTKAEVVKFLSTNAAINAVNFSFLRYRIYSLGYRKDIADAFNTENITLQVRGSLAPGVQATYYSDLDQLVVPQSFAISNFGDQVVLLHECTHALLDYQRIGIVPTAESEALAYFAEALFVLASGRTGAGTHPIRTKAAVLANKLWASKSYAVSAADSVDLVDTITRSGLYRARRPLNSNGFNRSIGDNFLRKL